VVKETSLTRHPQSITISLLPRGKHSENENLALSSRIAQQTTVNQLLQPRPIFYRLKGSVTGTEVYPNSPSSRNKPVMGIKTMANKWNNSVFLALEF
jgi:hypothetical protein